ncbi:MAG TPA: methylenetetrahydrofolate reductase [NAD(P)H] [Actinomycetales bacterium]|nr:methylenetetrahydrofolate reductase [NAD(P)H] [Actinomycetales bacterium]
MALGRPSVRPGGLSVQETIRDVLAAGGRSFSFEFMPPRDDEGERVLWQSLRRVERVSPTFVSVTYGAGGSTRDRTVRVVQRIAEETTLTPVAHLTCVAASRTEIRQVVRSFAAAGIRNLLALRGDPPGDPGGVFEPHPEGIDQAVELVAMLRSLGRFCIGVAAFPLGHPESPDLAHDARVLALKQEAGASYANTQFFFEADDYFRLRDLADAHGCTMPIIPGIMPVTNVRQIERFAQLSGSALPDHLVSRLRAVADDPAAVRQIGVETATELCSDLLAGGAPGLHFYTLNCSTATLDIYSRLGLASPVGSGR